MRVRCPSGPRCDFEGERLCLPPLLSMVDDFVHYLSAVNLLFGHQSAIRPHYLQSNDFVEHLAKDAADRFAGTLVEVLDQHEYKVERRCDHYLHRRSEKALGPVLFHLSEGESPFVATGISLALMLQLETVSANRRENYYLGIELFVLWL